MSAVVIEANEPSARYLALAEPALVREFELLANTEGGVGRLRQLILKLAVSGRLLPQLASDEAAALMLARARTESNRRMAAGLAKRERPALPVTQQEQALPLRKGWTWCRVVDTGQYINGLAFKPSDWSKTGRPIIRIQNLSGRSADFNRTSIDADTSVVVNAGDVLVSWSATLDAFIWRGEEGVLNQHIFRVVPSELVCKDFLFWLLKWVIRELAESDHAHGLVMSHINRGPFLAYPVAMPPLAEQHRIVARVEELMKLCDALEQSGRLADEQHARLTSTLFDALAASESAHALAENWQRIAEHFDLLLDRPKAIDALEQTILQLAVHGLLVQQGATDEPASSLLDRVRIERDREIAIGSMKRNKPLMAVAEDEQASQLPTGWQWTRLGLAGVTSTGGTPPTGRDDYFGTEVAYVKPGSIGPAGVTYAADGLSHSGAKLIGVVEPPSVLMVCIGGSIGKVALATRKCAFNQQINAVRPLIPTMAPYLLIALSSQDFQLQVFRRAGTSTLPIISKGKWEQLLIPLPPLAEQHRIVARVEELRLLCGELRDRLTAARRTQTLLADALVRSAQLGE